MVHRRRPSVAAPASWVAWASWDASGLRLPLDTGIRTISPPQTLVVLEAIRVTSVSKKEEPLHRVTVAVTGITYDRTRRTGATALAELLHLARVSRWQKWTPCKQR
jgi:hypothetical protein